MEIFTLECGSPYPSTPYPPHSPPPSSSTSLFSSSSSFSCFNRYLHEIFRVVRVYKLKKKSQVLLEELGTQARMFFASILQDEHRITKHKKTPHHITNSNSYNNVYRKCVPKTISLSLENVQVRYSPKIM